MILKCYQICLICIVFLLCFCQCNNEKPTEPSQPATTGTIHGTIRSAEDQSLIDMAMVRVIPGELVVYSDQAGFYSIENCSEGQYLLICSKEEFDSDSANVSVTAGQTTTANFDLTPEFDALVWQFDTDGPIYYSVPAIGSDGTIYVGTGRYLGTTSGSLYAIYPGGTLEWKVDLENNVTTAVIGDDGTIYVMDCRNVLYAFDPSSGLKWRYEDWENDDFTEVGQRNVAIGHDQTLYAYVAFDLYAIYPNGQRKWVFDPGTGGTPCGTSPVVGSDSTIYVILGDDILYAVNPDGSQKWKFYLENYDEHCYTSLTLDADDVIYFGTENRDGGYVYAVYPTGILKWRVFAGSLRPVRASPSIGADGTVYVATQACSHRQPAEVLSISPEGIINWRYPLESVHFTPDDAYATPAVGADGLIYAAAETGFVYALNPNGTLNWKQDLHCGINWSSPTLLDNGMLYIGGLTNEGGSLFALQTTSMGYASSPWPAYRQNNRHTGRVEY
ncbi:PQQ-binding-like beta-propeller repeat protein [bacterium]|nr:PQQ-binding-like beta-propeller repeat protein [bacterium]